MTLSGGERRRVEIARALLHAQPLFFLMNRSQGLILSPFLKSVT